MYFCVFQFAIFMLVATKSLNGKALQPSEITTNSTPVVTEPSVALKLLNHHYVQMGNGLETIPMGSPHVRSINFAYNHLDKLPANIFTNKSYKNLHKIELYQNQINDVNLLAFRNLKLLKFVDLSQNLLPTIDAVTFKSNSALEKLDLSSNQIHFEHDKFFLQSPSLEILILTRNKIDQIYEFTFVGVPNLKHLVLDYNGIFLMSPRSFVPLEQLQHLSLANTGVHKLSDTMFKTLPRILDLSNTPLANLFSPPLKRVKNEAVSRIVYFDSILINDLGV